MCAAPKKAVKKPARLSGRQGGATPPSFKENDVLELRVVLKDCEPKVQRTLLIRADSTFEDLHVCLQIAMGWENAHLHEFKLGKTRVGMQFEDDLYTDPDVLLEEDVRLFELLPECKGRFVYWYDFGDDWMHEIKAKPIAPAKYEGLTLPCCTAGEGACPPEDCGGPWGYMEMLETLRSGSAEEKEELLEWLGAPPDPNKFDLKAVNKALQS